MSPRTLRFSAIAWMLVTMAIAINQASAQPSSSKWTPIGKGIRSPNLGDSAGKHHQSGRLIQAAWSLDNKQAQNVLWMGAAVGGLWKSVVDSHGTIKSWMPLTDTFPGPHSMGAFLVHRRDSDKILVGPGSIWKSSGDGNVYRTTTQGATWTPYALPVFKTEQDLTRINRIVEDRSDPTGNTVFACTNNGIYKSRDFGIHWYRMFRGETDAHVDEVTDIVQDTGDPKVWYAAKLFNGMILRSTDSGKVGSWHLYFDQDKIPGSAGRVSLAACGADKNVLYALVIDSDNTTEGKLKGVYRSMDRAKNWTRIDDDNDDGTQGMHTCAIACDPTDAKHVLFGLKHPFETRNATAADPDWQKPDGGHDDYNFILFRLGMKNIVIANDGGYYIYEPDPQLAGAGTVDDSGNLLGINATFLEISNGGLASSRSRPEMFIAGLVDNGLVRGDTTAGTLVLMFSTDGGQVSIAPELPDVMAASTNSGFRRQSFDTGTTWLDISNGLTDDTFSSVLIDPTPGLVTPNIFNYSVHGLPDLPTSQVFFRSSILLPAFPWQQASLINMAGEFSHLDHTTDSVNDTLLITLKGDQHLWALSGPRAQLSLLAIFDRTPPLPTLVGTKMDAHANADKFQPRTIYYTTNSSRPSRAFLSRNDGLPGFWFDYTGDLPASAGDFVKLIGNPKNLLQLFLATSNGVYRTDGLSLNGKLHWYLYSEGLRLNEEVQDIVINSDQRNPATLYIATKGRGFWQRAIK